MVSKNSLVASLSISQWSGRKHDKKITEEVKDQHKATDDAGRYNKLLVAKKHTEAISQVASRARVFHYENTLPWGDNNERLLPTKNYFNYIGEMAKIKADFDIAIAAFFSNYDAIIEEAKIRLNGMFNERDYPSKIEIEDKFGFKTSFMPVPDSDIRLGLDSDEVEKIRADVEEQINSRLAGATNEMWVRIKDQLMHMRDKMADERGVFRDSLFENLRDLILLLPNLNVTDDPKITEICDDMKKLIVSPAAVRVTPELRSAAKDKVDEILAKFNQYF